MRHLLGMLAQSDPTSDLLSPGGRGFGDFKATDTLVILGFIVVLVVALFAWAFFIRRRPTEQHGAHALVRPSRRARRRSRRNREVAPAETGTDRRLRVRRRRRRRSREDLPRNPTLGETGGLPPPRPDEPDETSPPAESRA